MKKIILFAFSAFLALLAGCTADSFAPVAIPNHYSVKPPEPVNERDLTEQLKKLHTPDTSPYKITPGDQYMSIRSLRCGRSSSRRTVLSALR